MLGEKTMSQAARRRVIEIGVRVLLVVLVRSFFPDIFSDDVRHYWLRGLRLPHELPYRDFLWEFPPLTVLVLLPAPFTRHHFAVYLGAFTTLTVAAEYAALELLRRLRPARRQAIEAFWYVVALPLATIAWFRLDFFAVLLVAFALMDLQRRRSGAGPVTLGVAAKLWPAVLGVWLVFEGRWRQLFSVAVAVAVLVVGWWLFSPSGFAEFLRFRHGSGFNIESSIGAVRLLLGARPHVVSGAWVVDRGLYGWVDYVLLSLWLVLVAGVAVVGRRRALEPVAACGGLVMMLLLASRLLSPQFLVWPVPFLALAWADGERRAALAFAGATALTMVELLWYLQLVHGSNLLAVLVLARNVLLLVSAVALFARARSEARPREAVSRPTGPAARPVAPAIPRR